MPPRGPAKAREYDYSNVGKAGRRTGITLQEGRRDEYGMEEIDGMFSSPEKSPVRENGAGDYGNESAMSSDGMSMDEGNGPGPVDFLNGINGGRPSLFPPPAPSVSRSPMKTGLTGSPRRTPGLRSSSPQHHPSSATSSADRGMGGRRPGSGQDSSPLSRRSMNTPASNHAQRPRSKANGTEAAAAVEFSDSDGNSQLNGDENADTFEQAQDDFVEGTGAGDDSVAGSDHASPDAEMNGQNGLDDDSPPADTRRTEQAKPASKKKGTALDKGKGRDTSIRNETEQPTQKGKGRGRPPKAARTADAEGDQRPSKKAKTTDHRTQNEDEPLDPEVGKVVEDYANRTGPLKGRSLHILKREAPNHTRSGRVSIRPLAYWRNERCVYGDSGADEGVRYPTTTVKEVIRTEDIEPEKKRAGKRSSKKSKSKKNADKESDDEGDDYIDPWEKDGGVLHGYIRKWDPEMQTGTEEDEVLDIAYAPSGIETRDVKDSTFRFAKLLSSSFLGSGIVELPPGGVKKPKNSKKMHMVFYVCNGRVQIDVSGVQFSAGKGCVFQVPRGNYYSFANTSKMDARLFFTQGCVPTENDSTPPESVSRSIEGEQTPKPGRPAGARGRPKGKQKAGSKAAQS